MTTKNKIDLDRLSPKARHDYERGMSLVAARLKGHRRATAAELAAAQLTEGLRIVKHKLASAAKARTLAVSTASPAPGPKPIPPERWKGATVATVKRLHRLSVAGGIFG